MSRRHRFCHRLNASFVNSASTVSHASAATVQIVAIGVTVASEVTVASVVTKIFKIIQTRTFASSAATCSTWQSWKPRP